MFRDEDNFLLVMNIIAITTVILKEIYDYIKQEDYMKTKLVNGLWITSATVKGVEILTSDREYSLSVAKAIEQIKKIK